MGKMKLNKKVTSICFIVGIAFVGLSTPIISEQSSLIQKNVSIEKQKQQFEKIEKQKSLNAQREGVEYYGNNIYGDTSSNVYEVKYNQKWTYSREDYVSDETIEQTLSSEDDIVKLVLREGSYGDARFKSDGFFGGNHYDTADLSIGEEIPDNYDIWSFTGDGDGSNEDNGNEWVKDFRQPTRHNGAFAGSAYVRIEINATPSKITTKMYGSESSGWAPGWVDVEGQVKGFDLTYDIITEIDEYSFANDIYYLDEIQERINTGNYGEVGQIEHNPYFTKNDTYSNLERYLLDNDIISSRDNIPSEHTVINFYDEDGNLIDKNSNIDSDEIHIKLISDGTPNITGESSLMTFEIPYFENDVIFSTSTKNIFDWDETEKNDPTDNESTLYWEYVDEKWNLFTNIEQKFKLYDHEIEEITYTSLIDDNSFSNKIDDDQEIVFESYDKNTSVGKNYVGDVEILKENGKLFNFKLNFKSQNVGFKDKFDPNNDDINIVTETSNGFVNDNTSTDTFNELKNTKLVFDKNDDGITEYDEVFNANVVYEDFWLEPNRNIKNYTKYYYDESKNEFVPKNNSVNIDDKITEKGIYAYSYEDEYGNVSFELVEYIDENDYSSKSQLTKWDWNNDLYYDFLWDENLIYTDFDSLSYHEIQKLALDKVNEVSGSPSNLKNIEIDTIKLEEMSIVPPNRLDLESFKGPIETEIINQLSENYGFKINEDYKIEWVTPMDEMIGINTTLNFKIVDGPSNVTSGEQEFSFVANRS